MKHFDSELNLFLKRSRKRLKRLRAAREVARQHNLYVTALHEQDRVKHTREKYQSAILDVLHKNLPRGFRTIVHNYEVSIPRRFSIIDDPVAALRAIYRVVAVSRRSEVGSYHFDHAKLQDYDLAAEEILDAVVLEMRRERFIKRGRAFKMSGITPADTQAARFIWAVGILKNLGLSSQYPRPPGEKPLTIFEMRSKRFASPEDLQSMDFKAKAVKDFVDHINKCLGSVKRELTEEARWKVSEYTGEIMTNAEDHAGMDECMLVGYLDENSESHMCEIAIFNFGECISQTLRDLDPQSFTSKQIRPYIDAHASFLSPSWKLDDLLTLVALQGDVSRLNDSPESHRGQGTVDLIGFFQQVHHECRVDGGPPATMAILSGSTHIRFDGTHNMTKDAAGRNIIAFNSGNDLSLPPDTRYVRNLGDVFFPGTIISIRFPLLESQTREMK